MDSLLSGLDVSGSGRYEGRDDSDETKRRLIMNTKTTKSYYEIQYTTVWDDPDNWYTSSAAGQDSFKSYTEANNKLQELVAEQKSATNKIVSEYRIVEHKTTTTTEVLKNFLIFA